MAASATLFAGRLAAHARDREWPAILLPDGVVTYPALVARARRCAAWLVDRGLGPAPVGVSIGDDVAHLVVAVALLHLGVPQIGLAPSVPQAMRRELARRLPLSRMIADDACLGIPGVPSLALDAGALDAGFDGPAVSPLDANPDAIGVFATSSGTTGRAKLVPLSQRVMAARAEQIASALGFAPDVRFALAMPVDDYVGKAQRLNVLWHGGTLAFPTGTRTALPTIAQANALRVDVLQLSVLQARNLLHRGGDARLPATTRILLGAARMPPGFAREVESAVGGRVYDRYGSTEANLVATTYPDGDDGTTDAVGRPLRGIEIEIVDEDDRPVERGAVGEIRTRSPCVASGYHDDPVACARQFRGGWYYTGDAGRIDERGLLHLLGRRDDMMSLNGINIIPAEIECVLEAHPSVRTAAAFPIRSPIHGDIPAAAVELRTPGAVDAVEIVRYAREHLGERAPRKVVVVDALPRNAAGKVVKRLLATTLAERG